MYFTFNSLLGVLIYRKKRSIFLQRKNLENKLKSEVYTLFYLDSSTYGLQGMCCSENVVKNYRR